MKMGKSKVLITLIKFFCRSELPFGCGKGSKFTKCTLRLQKGQKVKFMKVWKRCDFLVKYE